MYNETNVNNYNQNVFVDFVRRDIIQIIIFIVYYIRLSTGNRKSMGRFRVQKLLPDGQWHSKNIIKKNTNHSNTSEEWTLSNLVFTEASYGMKLINNEIDKALADMCFSYIMITNFEF